MRVTRANISKAIKNKTGMDVALHGSPALGCYHFYSDDNETALKLSSLYSTTVYVNYISSFSVERWVIEFEALLETGDFYKPKGK